MYRLSIANPIGLVFLIATSTVSAEQPLDERAEKTHAVIQKRFKVADANGDGQLTREQVKFHMPFVYRNYAQIDKESKGSISLEQVASFAAQKM
jgi:hypothetical protein